ncbi:MAG: hypothetical protein Q6363_008040 [Candidatus Njordarchaeota archaeon]
MRIKVKVIIENGKIQVIFPEEEVLGRRCYDIGKNIRNALKKFIDLAGEKTEPHTRHKRLVDQGVDLCG